jgi:predicted HAD superfamily phosphohydrolase YqeG
MDKVAEKFNKLAEPLAEIAKEYIALEFIKNMEKNRWVSFAENFGFIPNIGAEKPFLQDSAYQIYIDKREEIIEKNDLPKYEYYRKPTFY